MMSEWVTYCMVMWLAIIQIIRVRHHDWNGSNQLNENIPEKTPNRVFNALEGLMLNNSVKVIYRLKTNFLWDTS
ncbi:hypothetical protein [Pseudalkalibacillus sp. SCS-8]|uniref:hypothetical protein n=1 Tax=Pseudalkalibacillus nanhaiensis TaxID=3115291 RepID=UPI0032DA48AF